MLDGLIRGGTVVDGTGGPPTDADVGIVGGRIRLVGRGEASEARTIYDASGLVVAPGFIDPHTHYDAQLLWDPHASPSNVHGVTTVVSGNCGFSLAPVRPRDRDMTLEDFSLTEGMPLESLRSGVDWSWEGFGEYIDTLAGKVAVNVGFFAGHCALRHYVMGDRAVGGDPTPDELEQMVAVLHECLDAGALGFSTTQGLGHSTHTGEPVASRWATREELLALSAATGEHVGTTLQLTLAGVLGRFTDDEIDQLVDMSLFAGRPLNWNMLFIDSADDEERVTHQLRASARARQAGGRVTALTLPGPQAMTQSLGSPCHLRVIPGFKELFDLPVEDRMERLRDPAHRREILERASAPGSPGADSFKHLMNFGDYAVGETFAPENAGLSGRMVSDIAAERQQDPFDTFVDVALKDGLRTAFWPKPRESQGCWELRRRTWRDDDVLLGGSDAGAHLDRLCGASYPTELLAETLRGHRLVSLEEAVHGLTSAPAAFFGLSRKGLLADGYDADIVVFDPDTVGSGTPYTAHDLPGGGWRLTSDSLGIRRVFVNGVETVVDGVATAALPGRVLRSGRDTTANTERAT